MNHEISEVIIIGAGPAGCSSAAYASRAGISPLVLDQRVSLSGKARMDDSPKSAEDALGATLMGEMLDQAENFGAKFIARDVTHVDLMHRTKRVIDGTGAVHRAKSVIIATGARRRELGLQNEEQLTGYGISRFAAYGGSWYQNMNVFIVGGGDMALEEAISLSRFARKVTVVHRREKVRASKIMQDRVRRHKKIHVIPNHEVTGIVGDGKVTGIRVCEMSGRGEGVLPADRVLISIGYEPQVQLIKGQISLNHAGYVAVEGRSSRTNVDGVFACGEVVDHEYRQVMSAAGSGCAAALDAERYLAALNDCTSPSEARIEATAVAELAY
ncbi:NAD(P)/FAD-dependent oxidoreductase [Streptomyces sp. NPDC056749]|uniref:NAD(P)/FAD-dependent oxidoreductase n=1 Tax=Streptomyces sp. NPDC056749 TaxID=3345936 RepID=UPI0036A8EF5F